MKSIMNPFIWEDNFPAVFGHTSFAFLKRCKGFNKAKEGDMQTASIVVGRCVKAHRIAQLKERYPEAALLPVITKNRLPLALAEAIGLEICTGVYEVHTAARKEMSGMERLLNKPVFVGEIKRGKEYILVDDIITQGGTISALRRYVLGCGGQVCAVSALACSIGAGAMTPAPKNLSKLVEKLGYVQLTNVLKEYGIIDSLYELTNQQVKYLLRFKDVKGIEDKLMNTYDTLSHRYKESLLSDSTA